jgi:SPP1 gp7 family putative phage head morphogenesis protein
LTKATNLETIRLRKKTRRIRKKRQPTWLYPSSQEREYKRNLLSLTKQLKSLINEYLIPEIPSMIAEVQAANPKVREDDFIDRLRGLIIFIGKSIQNKVDSTIREAEMTGIHISDFNKKQFDKINESVFGIDLFRNEPFLEDQLKLFSSQNAQYIKSIPSEELDRVSDIVQRGLQEGKRFKDVAKDIQKSYGITDRKAELIARDQTAKLNGSLTKLRQQEIGVDLYTWQTSGDERVRSSHKVLDGKTCKWSDPTVYLNKGKWVKRPSTWTHNHPLVDINCRCAAIGNYEALINR